MSVKGAVIKTISGFVASKYQDQYQEWLDRLPPGSQTIYKNNVKDKDWYPVNEGVILPTEIISEMFYSSPAHAAWESGYFSAAQNLTGLYKILILVNRPSFLISKASKALASFYDSAQLSVVESGTKYMVIHIVEFPVANDLVEYRIGGWMQKALEMCGCKSVNIDITSSLARGNELIEYSITWK